MLEATGQTTNDPEAELRLLQASPTVDAEYISILSELIPRFSFKSKDHSISDTNLPSLHYALAPFRRVTALIKLLLEDTTKRHSDLDQQVFELMLRVQGRVIGKSHEIAFRQF